MILTGVTRARPCGPGMESGSRLEWSSFKVVEKREVLEFVPCQTIDYVGLVWLVGSSENLPCEELKFRGSHMERLARSPDTTVTWYKGVFCLWGKKLVGLGGSSEV